jgi:hypothetical protein
MPADLAGRTAGAAALGDENAAAAAITVAWRQWYCQLVKLSAIFGATITPLLVIEWPA